MKNWSFLVLVFVSAFMYGQTISGKVVSKEDQQGVPFAKIGLVDSEFGVQTDENGQFQINLDGISKDKTLLVIIGGYETYKVKVSDFAGTSSQTIYLNPKVTQIQEVAIKAANYKEKTLGIQTKTKSVMFTPNMEKGVAVVTETAIEFNAKKRIKVMKINMNFARFESTLPIHVRYTIYDEKDGLPNNLILENDIIANIKPSDVVGQRFSMDVSKENIWLQGKFFVGIQFIGQTDGKVALSGALMRTGFFRKYYGNWEKLGFAAPSIHIDVKEKK